MSAFAVCSASFAATSSARQRPIIDMSGVRITRTGTAAVLEHEDIPSLVIRIELGPLAHTVSDREIVTRRDRQLLALAAASIASPQMAWDDAYERWRPRSRALSLVVADPADPVVLVDDLVLPIGELGRILASHGAHVFLVFLDD